MRDRGRGFEKKQSAGARRGCRTGIEKNDTACSRSSRKKEKKARKKKCKDFKQKRSDPRQLIANSSFRRGGKRIPATEIMEKGGKKPSACQRGGAEIGSAWISRM